MSIKLSATFIVGLLIIILLHPTIFAQTSSVSPFIFNIKSAQCNYMPLMRNQTGFRVKDDKLVGIVTALHGVADCAEISATTKDGTEYKNLEIVQVDIERDVALLWSTSIVSLGKEGLNIELASTLKEGDSLYAVGYPLNLDTQLPTSDLSLRGMVYLIDLLPGDENLLRPLIKRKSPDTGIQVLSIEGHLLPGHSGAPIFNQADQVVGVGNGGLDLGRVGIGWAIPWQQIEWKVVSQAISDSISEDDVETLKTLKNNDPVFFSFDPSEDQEIIVEKTVCKSAIGASYKNIDEFKQDLLNTAKKDAIGELFGEFLQSYTEVENSVVTEDRIRTSTVGFVRVEGSPEYKNHESNLADVCISIKAYINEQDRQAFKAQTITSDRVCITENLPGADLKNFVEEQAVIRALSNYEPRLKDWKKDELLPLMREKDFIDGQFDASTGAYCTQVEGSILPIEVKALIDTAILPLVDTSPTPTPPLTSTVLLTQTLSINPTNPTGNLAIPVKFNFGTKVYLTGFNGTGINGPNEVSIGGAPGSEDARQPMFSRDGKSVMVKATIDGVIGLYKLTASGFNPEIIIRRGSAEWPVLSPDGETVMFSEATLDYRLHQRLPSPDIETPEENIEEIFLNGFPIFAKNLLWSENNQLVFKGCAVWKREDGTCGTWITNANNLDPQRIIVGEAAQPMSIRGGILAYMFRDTGKDWDIFIMTLADRKITEITNNNFEDGLPAISPDGNSVAYISNESGQWGVWTVNLDGQNKKHWFDIDPSKGVFNIDDWSGERMSWRR